MTLHGTGGIAHLTREPPPDWRHTASLGIPPGTQTRCLVSILGDFAPICNTLDLNCI
ncbi:MAG TPA: hypothetical protein VN924_01780 [Bryobacteraceae bacterium]|nr:hypothetical protein [Bryobacteraceae bacterium]